MPAINRNTSRLSFSLALVLLLWNSASIAPAGNGDVVLLPYRKIKSGLTMEVDLTGVDGNGYRAIKFKLTNSPPVASTADRQVRVILRPSGWGPLGSVTVSDVIEIPEGATSAEKTISIPQSSEWYNMDLEVREGGSKLPDLSEPTLGTQTFRGGNDLEPYPSILLIDADVPTRSQRRMMSANLQSGVADPMPEFTLPDLRNLISVSPGQNSVYSGVLPDGSQPVSNTIQVNQVANSPRLEMFPFAEVPERWIDLSCFGITFISLDDLQKLSEQHPTRMQALRDWVASGPVLCVYGVGDDYKELKKLETLLTLPPLPDAEKPETPFRGWKQPEKSDRTQLRKPYGDGSGRAYQYSYGTPYGSVKMATAMAATTAEIASLPVAGNEPVSPNVRQGQPPFVSRPAQFGWVIAIGSPKAFPGSQDDWRQLYNSIPGDRESWPYRHGMSLSEKNDGFWNWHIPGVGAAPVFSFLFLATLFAVAIGPLNYWVLGRMQRLYMLLVTVPGGALVVTLALFAYALITDGLGVQVRVRSFTDLDQRTGRVASWSRQTYYASLVPSRGLKFPLDATVFPLEQLPTRRYGQTPRPRAIDWEPDGQRLKAGFLSSRSLAQFMVVRSGESESKLEVTPGSGAKAPPQVKNLLGTPLEMLVLRDVEGAYFWHDTLKEEASSALQPVSAVDARKKLSERLRIAEPSYPEGYDPTTTHGNAVTRFFGGSYYWNNASVGSPGTHASLLETRISTLHVTSVELLEPGTYLAVGISPPDVPLGVTRPRQKESLHVIHGRW